MTTPAHTRDARPAPYAPPQFLLDATLRRDFVVVVPALDEAECVPALFAALRDAFDRHGLDGEVVLVDDGSTDATWDVAREAAARFGPRARVVRHARNRGKTEAMLTGVAASEGTRVVLFDADLQHSPDEIPRFLAKLGEGWDIVTGRKVGAYEKRGVSRAYNWISARLFDVPVQDLNSMKAFRRDVLAGLPMRHDWHRFFVVLAHARGHSVTEIDIALRPRHAGRSKYTGARRVLSSVGDLVAVGVALRFSAKPMQLFGGIGALLIGAGLLVGSVTVAMRAMELPPPAIGYRPILALIALLVTAGISLLGFGFLAEMIAMLRSEVDELRREAHAARTRRDAE